MGRFRLQLQRVALVVVASVLTGCLSRAIPDAAPAAAPATAVPTVEKPAAPSLKCGPVIVGEQLLAAPLVVVGELHGTAEVPALFGEMLCHAAAHHPEGTILVGLEIDASAQAAVDAFLGSDGEPDARSALLDHAFWRREGQDGRSSEAGLALLDALRRLRAAGPKVVVRAVDPPRIDSAADRDAKMAAAVIGAIDALRPAKTLVLVGDVHSRVLGGYPWDPSDPYVPMGAHLRKKYPDMLGLGFRAFRGSAWTCSPDGECGAMRLREREIEGAVPRIELHPEALADAGWDGTLFLGEVSASPPARAGEAE